MHRRQQTAVFRFGNGQRKVARKRWTVPITLYGRHATLEFAVVPDSNLQLLLGKDALVDVSAHLDFGNGRVRLAAMSRDWHVRCEDMLNFVNYVVPICSKAESGSEATLLLWRAARGQLAPEIGIHQGE